MADGTTFPPFQTIPGLTPATALNFTDQLWINQAGLDRRCNIGDIANLMPTGAGVASFNGRIGAVTLTSADITGAGGATSAQLAAYLPLAGGNVTGTTNFSGAANFSAAANFTGPSGVGVSGGGMVFYASPVIEPGVTLQWVGSAGWADYVDPSSQERWWANSNIAALRMTPTGDATIAGGLTTGRTITSNSGALTAVTAKVTAAPALGVIDIDGPAGIGRNLAYTTSGVLRWTLGCGAAAESGGNAGSGLNLTPFDDTGVALPSVMTIQRATQVMNIAKLGVAGSTPHGVLIGQGSSAGATWTGVGGANQFLAGVAGADPVFRQPSSGDLSDVVARTTFTPTVTFSTPGDLTVAYTAQTGAYVKVGPMVMFWMNIQFTPTFTTAANTFCMSLPPIVPTDLLWGWSVRQLNGPASWPTGVTMFTPRCQNVGGVGNTIVLAGLGSGIAGSQLGAANFTSGVACIVSISGCYF